MNKGFIWLVVGYFLADKILPVLFHIGYIMAIVGAYAFGYELGLAHQ